MRIACLSYIISQTKWTCVLRAIRGVKIIGSGGGGRSNGTNSAHDRPTTCDQPWTSRFIHGSAMQPGTRAAVQPVRDGRWAVVLKMMSSVRSSRIMAASSSFDRSKTQSGSEASHHYSCTGELASSRYHFVHPAIRLCRSNNRYSLYMLLLLHLTVERKTTPVLKTQITTCYLMMHSTLLNIRSNSSTTPHGYYPPSFIHSRTSSEGTS